MHVSALVNSFVTQMPDDAARRMSRAKVRNKLGDAMYIEYRPNSD